MNGFGSRAGIFRYSREILAYICEVSSTLDILKGGPIPDPSCPKASMQLPTLSVVIPNYNHSKFLPQTLDAVFSQSVRAQEVVVVDDASTDNSIEIIRAYAAKYPELRLVQHETNKGAIESCNRALFEARYDYIYGTAADDYILPGFFEKALKMLARYPQAAICTSIPGILYPDKASPIPSPALRCDAKVASYYAPREVEPLVNGGYIASTPTVLKRDAMRATGGCTHEHRWHSDWFYLLVMAFRHGLCFLPEMTAVIRQEHESYSNAGTRDKSAQFEVISQLMQSVSSEKFRDVLPSFVRSRAFGHYRNDIVEVVTSRPELWRPEMLLLAGQFLWEDCEGQHRPAEKKLEARLEDYNAIARELYLELAQAKRFVAAEKHQEALQLLSKMIGTVPQFAEAYVLISQIFITLGQLSSAADVLRAAKELLPFRADILAELASVMTKMQDFNSAKALCAQALHIDPKSERTREVLGEIEGAPRALS